VPPAAAMLGNEGSIERREERALLYRGIPFADASPAASRADKNISLPPVVNVAGRGEGEQFTIVPVRHKRLV